MRVGISGIIRLRDIVILISAVVQQYDRTIRATRPVGNIGQAVAALRNSAGTKPAAIIVDDPVAQVCTTVGAGVRSHYHQLYILFITAGTLRYFIDHKLSFRGNMKEHAARNDCQYFFHVVLFI